MICGAKGDRTPDLCIANAALSQLSYCPDHASALSCRSEGAVYAFEPSSQARKRCILHALAVARNKRLGEQSPAIHRDEKKELEWDADLRGAQR